MNERKAVLIVGAGALQIPMMVEAQKLGLAVLATDRNPEAPGATVADEFYALDTADVPGHRRLGQVLADHDIWNLLGVVTCGSDSAPSVAAAAKGACVRGIPVEVAQTTHDKALVREALYGAHLNCYQPKWARVSPFLRSDEQLAVAQSAYNIRFPCIVKPLEERASRGVSVVYDGATYEEAKRKALAYGETFLLEERLVGSEHSAELILGNSHQILWWNIVDRYFDSSSGVPIEMGHVNPTCLDERAQQRILFMVLAAASALGVTWGPFKVDCMLTAEGPKVLECTARLSGGWDSQWSSPATDRHPMKLLLQLACGLPCEAQRGMADADGYGAVAAICPQHTGILEAVQYPLWAASAESLRGGMMDRQVVMVAQPGDEIHPLEHNAQRCGYVMAHGHNYAATWETAQQVAATFAGGMVITPPTLP